MNNSTEDLKQLLVSRYRKLGYDVTTDDQTIYLRFSSDSLSPAVMVRYTNESNPLDRFSVQNIFEDLERRAAQIGCHQFRLVNPGGFLPECAVFEDYNLALSDSSYLRNMIKPGYLDLYAHNEKMYRDIRTAFQSANKVAAVQATGSGKSLLIASSVRDNAGQRQLVIAPRTNIHMEIARHIPENVPVDYITFQMLGLKDSEGKLKSMKYDRIYIDEFHHAGATRWGAAVEKLLELNPDAKILGTTATSMHRHAAKGERDIALEMFDRVAGRMDLSDALVRHILRTPDYVCMPSSYEGLRDDLLKSAEVRNDRGKTDKINKLVDSWERDIPLHEIIRDKLPSTNCKMIVFSPDYNQLKKDKKLIADLMEKAGISYKGYDYYHSANKRTMEGLDRFKNEKTRTRAQIIFCIDMLNEGVHVPGVQAAFFLRHTESQTVFHQQLGRIMAAGSNDCTVVFDMVDNVYSRNISDLADDVQACNSNKTNVLSFPGHAYLDPEPVSFKVDDYLKSFRQQKEAVVPRQQGESFAEKLSRIVNTYTENGRIRIRVYNSQTRKDEEWFYMQTKKYAMGALSPEDKALMDKLKFDPYIPQEEKKQIELDNFIRSYKLHHSDINSMSIVDQAFYKRVISLLTANKLELEVYCKLADAGVSFAAVKVPSNYKIAQTFKLKTPEEVAQKMMELQGLKKSAKAKIGRSCLSEEQKRQNKLRKMVSLKSEGETYKVNGSERKFGGVKSREEIEALKRNAATSFMDKPSVWKRSR